MSMPPRRSSYASVVSGNVQPATAAASSNSTTTSPQPTPTPNPTRSGFMSHLVSSPHAHFEPVSEPPRTRPLSFEQQQQQPQQQHQHQQSQSQPTLSHPWDRRPSADDSMSRLEYAGLLPSYLENSRYVERLGERQRQRRQQQQRESRSARSSNPGSLSTSNSNMSLHKMVPSHRGMTHEIVERPYAVPEDEVGSLPSRWSNTDKFQGLDISIDGLDVHYVGSGKSQDEAASVRADCAVPREVGIYYYEVTVQGRNKEGLVGIGFSSQKSSLSKLPGWEAESWAYHGDDGYSFCQTHSGKPYGPRYGYMSTVGCGINFRTGAIFFTKDGVNLGPAFHDVRHPALFPSIGVKKSGEHLRANFGLSPFVYDIDGMVQQEKSLVQQQIDRADPTALSPSKSEDALLRDLVEQYLAHEGYIETAKTFGGELHRRDSLLQNGAATDGRADIKEDTDAIQRQRIRAAILEGDIDGALLYTHDFYPQVLRENENIDFKLKCRKFVEMIRRCSELSSKKPRKSVGSEFGVFDNDMEIDNNNQQQDYASSQGLMTDALMYGQRLQAEFRDDPRREVKQALEDTFALIAYTNAEESSLAPLLKADGRAVIAEELNSAILVWNGKLSSSAVERMLRQTHVLVSDLAAEGHGAALLNVGADYCRGSGSGGAREASEA